MSAPPKIPGVTWDAAPAAEPPKVPGVTWNTPAAKPAQAATVGDFGDLYADKAALGGAPNAMGAGAVLQGLFGPKEEIPRHYKAGSEYQDVRSAQRAGNASIRQQHPVMAAAADTLGTVTAMTPAMLAPVAAPAVFGGMAPATAAGAIGVNAALGGTMAAQQAANESNAPTAGGVWQDATREGAQGAINSGELAVGLGAAGPALKGAAGLVQGGSEVMRGVAGGAGKGGKVADILKTNTAGIRTRGDLGRAIERQGLTGGMPKRGAGYATAAEGAMPAAAENINGPVARATDQGVVPQEARTEAAKRLEEFVMSRAKRGAERDVGLGRPVNPSRGASLDAVREGRFQDVPNELRTEDWQTATGRPGGAGKGLPTKALLSDLDAAIERSRADRTHDGQAYTRTLEHQRNALTEGNAVQSPQDLLSLKRQYAANARYKPGQTTDPAVRPEAYREMRGIASDRLNAQMREQATPQDNAMFQKGNKDFQDLATIQDIGEAAGKRHMNLSPLRTAEMLGAGGSFMAGHGGHGLAAVGGAEAVAHAAPYAPDVAATMLKGTGIALRGVGTVPAAASQIPGAAAGANTAAQHDESVDSAILRDPEFGAMFSSMPVEARNVAHYVLLQTNPQFRARQRAAGEKTEE